MQALEIALFDAFAGKGMAAAEAASAAVGTGEVALYLGRESSGTWNFFDV